jgi:hypothetical protein
MLMLEEKKIGKPRNLEEMKQIGGRKGGGLRLPDFYKVSSVHLDES